MAELQLTKIKSFYGDIKGLLSQIPPAEKISRVHSFIAHRFNNSLDELSKVANTDYSIYRVPEHTMMRQPNKGFFPSPVVRAQIGSVVARLEEEYGFGKVSKVQEPLIYVQNNNDNQITLNVSQSLQQLSENQSDEEVKKLLKDLNESLSQKDKKNTKKILILLLKKSFDLAIAVMPEVIKRLGS